MVPRTRRAIAASREGARKRAGAGRASGEQLLEHSLNQQWRTWIGARARYATIRLPVTLVYGIADWSRPNEREANGRVIPGARMVSLERCGHFVSLEQPDAVARVIGEVV